MSDILSNLQITTWYKALVAISAAALLAVLAAQRDTLTMIFGGAVLIGLGEWKNHPKKEMQYRPTATGQVAVITDVPRKWTFVGTILQLIGLALAIAGASLLLGFSLPQLKQAAAALVRPLPGTLTSEINVMRERLLIAWKGEPDFQLVTRYARQAAKARRGRRCCHTTSCSS